MLLAEEPKTDSVGLVTISSFISSKNLRSPQCQGRRVSAVSSPGRNLSQKLPADFTSQNGFACLPSITGKGMASMVAFDCHA